MSRLGSPQAASRRVAIAKPKNDIFVALLAIATFVLLLGVLLLYLEFREYGHSTKPTVHAVPGATSPFDSSASLASTPCRAPLAPPV